MSKASKIAINSTIIFADGKVRASGEIVHRLSDDLVKLPRGYFPKAGAGLRVMVHMFDLMRTMPAHFSKTSIEQHQPRIAT